MLWLSTDHEHLIGRLRSPSSAASLKVATKAEKANRVNCGASTKATDSLPPPLVLVCTGDSDESCGFNNGFSNG